MPQQRLALSVLSCLIALLLWSTTAAASTTLLWHVPCGFSDTNHMVVGDVLGDARDEVVVAVWQDVLVLKS